MSEASPCKCCTKRHIKCHAECSDYAEWRKEKDDISRQAKQDKETWGYVRTTITRIKKRRKITRKSRNMED